MKNKRVAIFAVYGVRSHNAMSISWETQPDARSCALRWFGAFSASPPGAEINYDGVVVCDLPYSNSEYMVEVKAGNDWGSSSWSQPIIVKTLNSTKPLPCGHCFWLSGEDWERAFKYAGNSGLVANGNFEIGSGANIANWNIINNLPGIAYFYSASEVKTSGSKSLKYIWTSHSEIGLRN